MRRSCLNAAIAIAVALVIFSRVASAASAANAGPLTPSEWKAIHSKLRPLQDRLAALRSDPAVNADHWADAEIFVKGIIWTLDFEPVLDDKSRELVEKALRRAQERIESLATGRPLWAAKRGRSIRGFVSAVDGSTQPYGIVIPAGYDPARPIRLDVVLHGSRKATGIGELMFIEVFDEGDSDKIGSPAPNVDYIEVHPMGRLGENAYRFEGETDVDEAIEAVSRHYRIDRARIVLRGSSLGGIATWQLGLKRPDRYAAIGPTAAPVDTYKFAATPYPHFAPLEPLTAWQKTMLHLVDAIDYTANAGMVPVVALMGEHDHYMSSHLLMEQEFKKEGIPFVGLVDLGAGHGVTPKAFQEQLRLIAPHAAQGKDPAPRHIRFVTWTLKFSRCHWIEVLGLEQHYRRAEIDARLADDGSVTVAEPRNITRFAIRAPALQSPSATLTVAGTKIVLPQQPAGAGRTVVVERKNGAWAYQGDLGEITLTGKRPGLQGPIDDAFATPFLCVQGTGKALNPIVGDWAEANLKRVADEWRRHYRGYLPIKDDTEVTQDDLARRNLILFGDPGSNRWIGDIVPKLPLVWNRKEIRLGKDRYSAADHGLALIFPNPLPGAEGRYVVLNSGHTYHTQELRFSYMVFPRLGDWAVLKLGENSPTAPSSTVAETVLQSGFFNDAWSRPVGADYQ